MSSKSLLNLAEKIKPEHSAVVVIDMQNDFCSPEGVVSCTRDWRGVQTIIPRLRDFLDKARDRQVRVIFVQMIHEEKDFSGPERELMARWGRQDYACKLGSWGGKFDDNLQPKDTDVIVQKKEWEVRTLVLIGVSTNVCVESTARDGFMRDYYIILPRDLTAAYEKSLYEAALKNIDGHFGQVVSSEEVLEIWQGTKAD